MDTEKIRKIIKGADREQYCRYCDIQEWSTDDKYHSPTLQDGCYGSYVRKHAISDLREILALRERVAELEDNIAMALSHNSMSYLLKNIGINYSCLKYK